MDVIGTPVVAIELTGEISCGLECLAWVLIRNDAKYHSKTVSVKFK